MSDEVRRDNYWRFPQKMKAFHILLIRLIRIKKDIKSLRFIGANIEIAPPYI